MEMTTHWIIMPVHGGRQMTEKAIESCLAQDIPTQMFIIDNGSIDGTAQYLNGLNPKRVTVIHFMPQKGVSKAWNVGLEYVFRQGAEYALVVNSDVVLRPDAYRLLIEDGGDFVTCVGSDDPKCVEMTSAPNPEAKRPHPDFSAYFIRRTVSDRIGLFDERFFNYASDGDIHLRMHAAGIEAYCLDLPFYHIASGTTKVSDPETKVLLARIANRDRAEFEKKWGFKMGSDSYYAKFGHGRPDDPGAARA